MVTNGDNGTIGANGASDDPFETMMIHWSYNGDNGNNNSNRYDTLAENSVHIVSNIITVTKM